jgi:hypothetical protein
LFRHYVGGEPMRTCDLIPRNIEINFRGPEI